MFYDNNGHVFTDDKIDDFISFIKPDIQWVTQKKFERSINGHIFVDYANCSCAFDTETTSIIVDNVKTGFMYIWMFGINGVCIYGRTWDSFKDLTDKLEKEFELNYTRRLVCYVHNLPFDFQFMNKYYEWSEVFCINTRSPIYAITRSGVEYRCSYALTGVRLEKMGEDLVTHKCNKLVGDLDYNKVRHHNTVITEKELGYCLNDIRVIMCKIQECIEIEGDVTKIPLTKTGYVRRDVRRAVMKDKKTFNKIQDLKLTEEELEMWEKAFQGGFTHTNAYKSGITQEDVVSYDFTSSYPTVMISEKYPMSNGTKIDCSKLTYEEFCEYIRTYSCVMEIVMTNVKLKDGMGDAPISRSKCLMLDRDEDDIVDVEENVFDNGRIRKAIKICTTISEQNFLIYRKFYSFEYKIVKMYIYKKDYLPKPFIECVLSYYNNKTMLKDVEGKEVDYQLAKALLNAIFGMMVMAIERPVFPYENGVGWNEEYMRERSESLEEYNNNRNRFTWFPWGVYITDYARVNLFTGIYECGKQDYIYSDTDSIKILNAKDHEDYILTYNRMITDKLEACLDHYGIDKSLICPKTIEGVEKPLGVWDFDGHYTRFKALRAKCYLVEKDNGELKTTIAGVAKKAGAKYLSKKENPFDAFDFGMCIPADETGKKTHIYNDDELQFECTDYNGITTTVTTKGGIYLENAKFELSENDDYEKLLAKLHLGYDEEEI